MGNEGQRAVHAVCTCSPTQSHPPHPVSHPQDTATLLLPMHLPTPHADAYQHAPTHPATHTCARRLPKIRSVCPDTARYACVIVPKHVREGPWAAFDARCEGASSCGRQVLAHRAWGGLDRPRAAKVAGGAAAATRGVTLPGDVITIEARATLVRAPGERGVIGSGAGGASVSHPLSEGTAPYQARCLNGGQCRAVTHERDLGDGGCEVGVRWG